jgi:hypothetical protein
MKTKKKFERKESTTQGGIKINEWEPDYDNIQIDNISCEIDTHKQGKKRITYLSIHRVISISKRSLQLKNGSAVIIETIKYENIDGEICVIQTDKFMK